MTEPLERFPEHLDLRKLQEYRWELLQDFVYISPRWGRLVVPAKFMTDLASVPGIARFAVSRDGDHVKPAIVHDYGYSHHGPESRPWVHMTRRDVDRLFLEAMRIRGVKYWRRALIYLAVRVGGYWSYRPAASCPSGGVPAGRTAWGAVLGRLGGQPPSRGPGAG